MLDRLLRARAQKFLASSNSRRSTFPPLLPLIITFVRLANVDDYALEITVVMSRSDFFELPAHKQFMLRVKAAFSYETRCPLAHSQTQTHSHAPPLTHIKPTRAQKTSGTALFCLGLDYNLFFFLTLSVHTTKNIRSPRSPRARIKNTSCMIVCRPLYSNLLVTLHTRLHALASSSLAALAARRLHVHNFHSKIWVLYYVDFF